MIRIVPGLCRGMISPRFSYKVSEMQINIAKAITKKMQEDMALIPFVVATKSPDSLSRAYQVDVVLFWVTLDMMLRCIVDRCSLYALLICKGYNYVSCVVTLSYKDWIKAYCSEQNVGQLLRNAG